MANPVTEEPTNARALSSPMAQKIGIEQIQWIIKECCELTHVPPPVGSFPYDEMTHPQNVNRDYPWDDPRNGRENP